MSDGVHKVDALGELVRGLLSGGSAGIPETDCAIPGASNDGIWEESGDASGVIEGKK